MIDKRLETYATPTQLNYIKAVNEHGTARKAAHALGVHHSAVNRSLAACRTAAAKQGYSPEHDWVNPVPETHNAHRVSSHYTKGVLDQQWVIATLDEQRAKEARQAALEALAETLPRLAPTPAKQSYHASLCNLYTLTDCHVGMLAWPKETGAPWDLDIAETTLVGCFERMILSSMPAKVAFVNQLGDFLHSDGMKSVTPEHGHLLDSDGRFEKVVRVAIRVLRRVVDLALSHHEEVIVLLAEGNHDPASSIWLRAMFAALYENEPRVRVIDSPLPYYVHQHGETMLAFHHGHLSKNEQLPILFASTHSRVWGETTKRYAHTGHRHHSHEKEYSGMTVFQHPTLAARDAYAARGGWVADRQATAITYHSTFGEVGRSTVTPEMLG